MGQFVQFLVSGLAGGGITALVALALVILFAPTKVLSFAQGSLVSLAGVVLWLVTARLTMFSGMPQVPRFILALVLAIVLVAGLGVAFQYAVVNRAIGQPMFLLAILTIGLSTVIDTGVNAKLPPTVNSVDSPISDGVIHVAGTTVAGSDLWIIGTVLVVLAVLFVWMRFSKVGLAVRAAALDPEAAAVLGISLPRTFALAWAVSGMLSAIAAAAILSGAGSSLTPNLSALTLASFPAVILGGFEMGGTVLAAFSIGLVQSYFQFYQPTLFGPSFYTIAPFFVMVAILLVRPQGLFGHLEVERA
jgi:branched-chain amino acid transport system permease protein